MSRRIYDLYWFQVWGSVRELTHPNTREQNAMWCGHYCEFCAYHIPAHRRFYITKDVGIAFFPKKLQILACIEYIPQTDKFNVTIYED